MSTFKKIYKQFVHVPPAQILDFKEAEVARGNRAEMGDYAELSMFDLRNELCFKLLVGDRVAGFATARFDRNRNSRRLLRIYVTPEFRRHGMASWVLDEMPVTFIDVPVRFTTLYNLCRKKGYVLNAKQYSKHMAEFTRSVRPSQPVSTKRGTLDRISAR